MIHWSKGTELCFYKDITYSSVAAEVFKLIEGVESINNDLFIRQQSLVENYYRFLISKNNPSQRVRVNSSISSKGFNYGLKEHGQRKPKYFSYETERLPYVLTSEINYSLDFLNEGGHSKLSSTLELNKMLDHYNFSVRYKKYEVLCEYWDIYLVRVELEVMKKRLKRQKQLLTEFHFRNYFGNTNYEEILHSILDLKTQLNVYKSSINIFTKKVQGFVIKNNLNTLFLKYTLNLFDFKGVCLNEFWKVFNKVNSYNFIFKSHIYKNKDLREVQTTIFREIMSVKKGVLQKIPQIDLTLNYERGFSEKKQKIENLKGSYSVTSYKPQENVFIGLKSYITLPNTNTSLWGDLVKSSKLKRVVVDYEHRLLVSSINQEYLLKKAYVLKREVVDLKTRLLIKYKVLNYRKKKVFNSKFEVNKWRDLELSYLNVNVKLQRRLVDYFKVLMQININTI